MLLFAMLVTLNFMDAALTTHFILTTDPSVENNPILRYGIERWGIWFMWAFKGTILAALGYALYLYHDSRTVNRILLVLIIIYSYVCTHSAMVFYATEMS